MEEDKDGKRKKSKHDNDEDSRRERKSKRARSRSRTPSQSRETESRRKRRHSRSTSRERNVKQDRHRETEAEVKKEAPERKRKETDMLNTRTGGAYIPPARLRLMQAQITDKSSVAFQRLAWEALKKSIHGHINKINVGNIGVIIKELLKENIVRGRGLLCRSVIQAQAASPTFTNVYAALVAAVNSRFPNIGELLLKRLVIQFKRGFKRNDKAICISSASFIAHLVNQRVAHEILALELLTLLVETPSDDSVEVAIAFLKECGQKLTEVSSKGVNAIFEMLRNILHEGQLDKRVQYMIEVMFQVWKDGFKDHPAVLEELELVPEEEQFTHLLMLDDATDPQDILNVFKHDEKFEENEEKYKTLCREILGSDADTDDEEGSEGSGSEESEEDDAEGTQQDEQKGMTIIDNTETNLIALRRTIYLTINSSLDFEECAHKLMKMQLKPGQEVELCHMFLDCCAEQRTYEKFYGLLAQRFCNINRMYIEPFEQIFRDSYSTAHRLDTNRLRNVSKFFAHLLFTDSISWAVLECVKLNEEDTTSSSRIYIKILFQELAEYMGLKKLNDRLKDPTLQESFRNVFPRDNPKNTRFSINFFTSIGLGGLTDELREHLKQMPKNVPPMPDINLAGDSSSSSSSSSSDSSTSDSSDDEGESGDEADKNKKKDKTKKNKTKEKSPITTEENVEKPKISERWGHDGFYETYGKDARRTESRPNRPDKDDHNFVRPRPRKDDRRQGDGDERRRDDRCRQEDEVQRNRESRSHNKHENESRNSKVDDRDNHRKDERDRDGDRESDQGRTERDRRINDERQNDKNSYHTDRNADRRRENDRHREDSEVSNRRNDKDRRNDQNEERSRNERDRRDSNRDQGKENDRHRVYSEVSNRRNDKDKRNDQNEKRSRNERDRRDSNIDQRKETERSKRAKESDLDEDTRKKDRESRGRDRGEDYRRNNKDQSKSGICDDESRTRREDRNKDLKNKETSDSDEDDRSKKHKNEKEKQPNSKERRRNYSDSDEEQQKEKRKKEKKKDRKSSRREKKSKDDDGWDIRQDRKIDSDSDAEKEREKRNKGRKGKKSSRDDKMSKKDDGWDIKTADSVIKEVHVGRYWEN